MSYRDVLCLKNCDQAKPCMSGFCNIYDKAFDLIRKKIRTLLEQVAQSSPNYDGVLGRDNEPSLVAPVGSVHCIAAKCKPLT